MLCQLHRNVKAPYCPICLQERLAEQKMELEQWRAENQDTENPQVRPMTKTENLLMDAMRCIAELKAEIRRLREYYDAHQAIEHGIVDFDLHHDAVERLKRAQQALRKTNNKSGPPATCRKPGAPQSERLGDGSDKIVCK